MSLLSSIKRRLSSDEKCGHHSASFDSDEYWYIIREENPREYWCEHDAVFVKTQSVEQVKVCRYCGELKRVATAEELGGPDNIIRKVDIEKGIAEPPEEKVTCGAYKGINQEEIDDKQPITEVMEKFEETVSEKKRNTDLNLF